MTLQIALSAEAARKAKPRTTRRIIPFTVVREDPIPGDGAMDTPQQAYSFWMGVIARQPDYEPDKETLCVVCLNTKLVAYSWHRVSLGTVDQTLAHPREILRPVIAAAAFGFVIMHNHPSGDPTPSRSDESLTRRLREASDLMQFRFLDHVIVGRTHPAREPFFSFREAGLV